MGWKTQVDYLSWSKLKESCVKGKNQGDVEITPFSGEDLRRGQILNRQLQINRRRDHQYFFSSTGGDFCRKFFNHLSSHTIPRPAHRRNSLTKYIKNGFFSRSPPPTSLGVMWFCFLALSTHSDKTKDCGEKIFSLVSEVINTDGLPSSFDIYFDLSAHNC